MYRVFDTYLGTPQRDWSSEFLKAARRSRDQAAAIRMSLEGTRVEGTIPSLPLEKYAGTYQHDGYGEATVCEEGSKLVVQYGPAFIGDLEHWHYNTFQAAWRDRLQGKVLVTFTLNAQGEVDEMRVVMWNISALVYKRRAEVADSITRAP